MNTALHPLTAVKQLLQNIVEQNDVVRLRECLGGLHLPALGGNEHPAHLIYRALSLPPVTPHLGPGLSQLTATLCHQRAAALQQAMEEEEQLAISGGTSAAVTVTPEHDELLSDESYLFNLFLFASLLPAQAELFDGLLQFNTEGLHIQVLSRGGGRVARQLRQALTFQQVDTQLEPQWLGLIESVSNSTAPLNSDQRTDLLDGWRGLLWLPPVGDTEETPFRLSRLEKGLLGILKACQNDFEATPLLRYALQQLDNAYPASPPYWHEVLQNQLPNWPELLQDLIDERWPMINEGLVVPDEAQSVWQALSSEERDELQQLAEAGDRKPWKALWNRMVFEAPRAGISPQQWRSALNQIEHLFEAQYPELGVNKKQQSVEALAEHEKLASEKPGVIPSPKQRRGKGRGIDRLKARDRVNQVMGSIASQLRVNNPAKAAEYLEELVASQQKEGTEAAFIAKTLANAATLARNGGLYEWAEGLYLQAQSLAHDDVVAFTGLAEVYRAQHKLVEAEALYRECTQRWPNYVVAHNGLAETLRECGKLEEAETLYRESTQRWPNDVFAHNGLAETLRQRDKLEEAETLYRECTQRWPNDVVAHSGLAETLRERGKLEEAETLYREAAQRWPNNVVAHNGLAETLRERGKLEEAETLYRESTQRWPNDVVAHNGLAETLRERGKLEEAETLYRESTQRWPNNVVAHSGLAETLRQRDKLEEAETLYRECTQRWPNDVVAHSGLVETLRERGKLEEAETLYRECTQRWPNNVVAHNGLAETLRERGKLEEAETLYRESTQRWPNDVVAHSGLAETLRERGKLEEAEALYRECTQRWPNDAVARHGLANTLRKLKRFPEALELLPEPVTSGLLSAQYDLHLRAMILLESGGAEEAAGLFRRALSEKMSVKQQRIFRSALALAELKLRHSDEAADLLGEADDDSPVSNVIRLHAYVAAGRREQAQAVYQNLHASPTRLNKKVDESLQLIEAAYCINAEGSNCAPDEAQFDAIIGSEIDLLLAA